MQSLALTKRIAVILLSALLICTFVACKKKEVEVVVSSSDTSSSAGSVNSKIEIMEEDNDDAVSMTSSALEDIEEGTFGNATSSFTPLPQASQPSASTGSNQGSSSVPGYIGNGPGAFVPSQDSSSTTSSSTTSSSTTSSSTTSSSTPSSSEESSSEELRLPGYISGWY